jgi:hypothetical protein
MLYLAFMSHKGRIKAARRIKAWTVAGNMKRQIRYIGWTEIRMYATQSIETV